MENKKILIIDDEENIRIQLKDFFESLSWEVTVAENGIIGLDLIKEHTLLYDCVLLDWVMPEMNGEKVLTELNKLNIDLPYIIVLSAYIDNKDIFNKCQALNARFLLNKPVSQFYILEIIEQILNNNIHSIPKKDGEQNLTLFRSSAGYGLTNVTNRKGLKIQEATSNEVYISNKTSEHAKLIENYFESNTKLQFNLTNTEPLFIVARRWNSWYPSFFDIPGGSYAIVGKKNLKGKRDISIIDPGFKFLSVTNNLGLSISDMDSCILTHNHPDHIGGIFEYLACRNTLNKPVTKLLCNPSTEAMFNTLSSESLSVFPLIENENEVFKYNFNKDKFFNLSVRRIKTFHNEIGTINDSYGLIFRTRIVKDSDILNSEYKELIIFGDTAYRTADHKNKFITPNINRDTKIIVLHIGCSQLEQKLGKHLYLTGLYQILEDINVTLREINYQNKLLILVSEWGLEHASKTQMEKICPAIAKNFVSTSLILETIELFKQRFDKITLLPGDIGLTVGMTSGNIYLKNQQKKPEEIKLSIDQFGIIYS